MDFLDRTEELARLDRLMASEAGGLAVLYGRRRIGKTRLLLEWSRRHGGLYTVADQSAAEVQIRYFAETVAQVIPDFETVDYRDWRGLLARLAREAKRVGFRGPIVFDELPYLVTASPELPSVLQRFVDHEAREAGLVVAVAGSSQRMMQGLVLSREAPLFGRARELMPLRPIEVPWLRAVFGERRAIDIIRLHVAWGGIPRYWELAADVGGSVQEQIDRLVLDPLGPLHREPDRLLLEEVPSAMEVRPLLDAIGAGAHRLTEIGSRLGRPATSMTRPIARLVEMGLVRREVPFGESEKKSRRSLYRIDDPFFRLWFRAVAPHRGILAASPPAGRRLLLERFWNGLLGEGWEELCRQRVPRVLSLPGGPWGPAKRWWRASEPEWDVVAESLDGERLLLGEVKGSSTPFSTTALERLARKVVARPAPRLPENYASHQATRAIFVPEIESAAVDALDADSRLGGVHVITGDELTRAE